MFWTDITFFFMKEWVELESRKCGKYLFNPSTGETKRASKGSQTSLLKPKEVCIYNTTNAMIVLLTCDIVNTGSFDNTTC